MNKGRLRTSVLGCLAACLVGSLAAGYVVADTCCTMQGCPGGPPPNYCGGWCAGGIGCNCLGGQRCGAPDCGAAGCNGLTYTCADSASGVGCDRPNCGANGTCPNVCAYHNNPDCIPNCGACYPYCGGYGCQNMGCACGGSQACDCGGNGCAGACPQVCPDGWTSQPCGGSGPCQCGSRCCLACPPRCTQSSSSRSGCWYDIMNHCTANACPCCVNATCEGGPGGPCGQCRLSSAGVCLCLCGGCTEMPGGP